MVREQLSEEEGNGRMGEHRRTSMIERIVHRVEEHIEEWRRQEAARAAEAEANRDQLWAAAAERERRLAELIGEEQAHRASSEEIMKEHKVAFVVHSEEVAHTLESFAKSGDRLVKVIPSTRGTYAKEMGIKGSWLVFETSE
jgi:regulator of protease activity HflC (stomatin/prohibitin superfamily)